MSTVEDLNQTVTDLTAAIATQAASLDAIDLKLDEVRAFIENLPQGVVSQEQLDAAVASLATAKDAILTANTKAADVLAEADALDE